MLVAAVLRPEEREDGELEVVRLAPQQLEDALELPVREAELAMERLFRDGAQEVSLAGAGRRSEREDGWHRQTTVHRIARVRAGRPSGTGRDP